MEHFVDCSWHHLVIINRRVCFGISTSSLWSLIHSCPCCPVLRRRVLVNSPQDRCVPHWRCAGWCRCWGLLLWSSGRPGCQSSCSSGSSAASFSTSDSRLPLPLPAALWTEGRMNTVSDNNSVRGLVGQWITDRSISPLHLWLVPSNHKSFPPTNLICSLTLVTSTHEPSVPV